MSKTKEEWKTYGDVFDQFTMRTIFTLSGRGHFDALDGPLSIGKEANLFLAHKGKEKIVVKIYRMATCDFKKMFDYIKTDSRYLGLRKHRRRIIFSWVQREYRNLLKAREAGVSVPTPLAWKNNVLVLEFIGNGAPAPRVKDCPPQNPEDFCKRIVVNMTKLSSAGLVHGDLSCFNILNHHEKPVFIDFSQCHVKESAFASDLLKRDVKNIVAYCKKINAPLPQEQISQLLAHADE